MLTLVSPSKLNLFLEVLGRRPDGYHELDTVMLRTEFCDMLSAAATSDGNVTLEFSTATPDALTTGIPLDERNLILRAANAFRNRYGIRTGARFVLQKQIPPESGLGGGSGNAATALLACREIFAVPAADSELHELAASLGSDINFLLAGCRAAVCRGRGEQITPFRLPGQLHFLAVRPPQGNSTPAVFRQTILPVECRSSAPLTDALEHGRFNEIPRHCFNRLTAAACSLNPQMAELMQRLEWICRQPVWMSGSGSTVFTLCRNRQHMRELQQTLLQRWKIRCWALTV